MSSRGYARTTDQCYSRIKRLKYGFLHEKQDFKFFSEMDGIFRKQLKAGDSDSELLVPEEPEDGVVEPELSRAVSSAQWLPENSKQIWTDGETEALLNIWSSGDIQQMLKGSAINKQIYSQVSELLASQGFLRTPEQCQNRIKRLKANFRQFLEGRKGERQEFKFFDQMVQLFGNKYITNSDPAAEHAADGA
uniref:Myb/SANT-like DNA-binding domain-containing protein n=2 Tax=Tetraodon nigroviridis TaxID=99883 RepID=H3DMG4_TETNG